MQINQRHLLFLGHLAYRCGIVSVGVSNLTLGIKSSPLNGRDQHRNSAFLSCLAYKPLQITLVAGKWSNPFTLLFLVIVAKLNEKIVPRFHYTNNFIETPGAK